MPRWGLRNLLAADVCGVLPGGCEAVMIFLLRDRQKSQTIS